MTTEPTTSSVRMQRRRFLRGAALFGASLPVVGGLFAASCNTSEAPKESLRAVPVGTATPNPHGTAAAAATTAPRNARVALDMDAMHKKGVEDFLKNQTTPLTKGRGNVPLQPTLAGGVKVFNLTIDEVDWEVAPGQIEKGRGYNKMIPGPLLRATEGDQVRIIVKNNLTESTAVHWHGIYVPNNMDGVPYVTQEPIKVGETFTYEFTLRNSGTHMYHSHHNSMDQVNRGLLGAFIIDPKDPATYPKFDREYIMVINDNSLGYTLNGKGFPATDALTAKKGEKVLVRWLNEGIMNHPMHLHGMPMQVFAMDGWPLPNPYLCDTVDVSPGNRVDTMIDATETGVWAFHCHVLNHAESEAGMFGLVTVLIVS
ncbi:MAG: multicopper oxidase family protein [Dehalococcoidia bacterium]